MSKEYQYQMALTLFILFILEFIMPFGVKKYRVEKSDRLLVQIITAYNSLMAATMIPPTETVVANDQTIN